MKIWAFLREGVRSFKIVVQHIDYGREHVWGERQFESVKFFLFSHPEVEGVGIFVVWDTIRQEYTLRRKTILPAGPLVEGAREEIEDLWIFTHRERMNLSAPGLERMLLSRAGMISGVPPPAEEPGPGNL